MSHARHPLVGVISALICLAATPLASAPPQTTAPTIAQFLSADAPQEIAAAAKVDRIAWLDYAEGRRNVYTAAAPAFTPVRLTNYMKDDGLDLSNVRISDDGSTVIFVRGLSPNREGWVANPTADPNGTERAIWAAHTAHPGVSWRVAEGASTELSPDGSSVLITKDKQIYRVLTSQTRPTSPMDRGEKPFIKEWGTNSNPRWSPDGKKIAFVSNRVDHTLVLVYDMATRKVTYMSASVDHDTNPVWSADCKHLIFIRRPGTPFGQQAQQGRGGLGAPDGPAFHPPAPAPARGGAPAAGQGAGNAPPARAAKPPAVPGLMTAAFKGGYNVSLWIADVATGEAHEFWHNQPGDKVFTNVSNIHWAGDNIIFPFVPAGGGRGQGQDPAAAPAAPVDEWDRFYSISVTTPNAKPVLLTMTDGLIEDDSSIAFSSDGKTFYYCTNASDLERRHIWAVPTSGGTPRQVTTGEGIETHPTPLASGKMLATLSADWKMPQSIGVWQTAGGAQRIVFPTSRKGFPMDAHVKPQIILTKAADGLEIHNQLFLPKDMKPGEKHPALIFVHGGPVRQMLPAYHYMQTYHWFYGVNEWLASQGYIVLSVNYRSGIGYGRSFKNAPNTGPKGNSEYQDVVAGAKYLQSRPDVDSKRIGIWGLSYGGLLTAQALARNSDIFAAGVDLAGVHLYGSSLDPSEVTYQSSAISQIEKWKSPVLLIHGDDDRNVAFQQTTGLVQLLRQHDIYYELIVFPDDVHESQLYSRWMYSLDRMQQFLQKFLGDGASHSGGR